MKGTKESVLSMLSPQSLEIRLYKDDHDWSHVIWSNQGNYIETRLNIVYMGL